MEEPPLEGAVQVTTDWPLLYDVALTPVGAPGGPVAVMAFDEDELGPVPEPLVAVTLKV
jgi:hypothetical protein